MDDPFKRIDKFGIQLLLAFAFSLFILLFSNVAFANARWMSKPVQCGNDNELTQLLEQDGQKPMMAAVAIVSFEQSDGTMQNYEMPVVFFYNEDKKRFSMVEFNPEINEACVVSFGGGLDFTVADWYYNSKEN